MTLTQTSTTKPSPVHLALSSHEINALLKTVPNWKLMDHSLVREFIFDDFEQSIDFVNQVAKEAEAMNHHPDIFISYDKVKLILSTHTAKGLTNKDFDLAVKFDTTVQT